jgi:hypothetical protein
MALPASFNIFHQIQAKATNYRSTIETPAARRHCWMWRTIYNDGAVRTDVGLISLNRLMRIPGPPICDQSIQACLTSQPGPSEASQRDTPPIDFMNINLQYLSLVRYY